jgi:hypothetical protein
VTPSPQVLPPVPCLDHGRPTSACELDLPALAARRIELTKKRNGLRALMPTLEADARRSIDAHGVRLDAARRELAKATRELRVLYAVRAHHRGRVHETKRDRSSCTAELTHTGTITLEHQSYEVVAAWLRFKRKAVRSAAE